MGGVDEDERRVLAGLGRRVVAQVGGEVRVDAGRPYGVEQAVAGAAADGDRADGRAAGGSGGADPLRGGGEACGGQLGELGDAQGPFELADAAQAPAARRVAGVGHEGSRDAQPEGGGEGVGDAGVGAVRVGVGDVEGDPVADERVHDAALERVGRDGRGAPQVERVVGDEEVGAEADGLVHDRGDRVDGEQHPPDLGVRVTADRADGVPALGPFAGPEGVEGGGHVGESGHAPRLPASRERASGEPFRSPGGGAAARGACPALTLACEG